MSVPVCAPSTPASQPASQAQVLIVEDDQSLNELLSRQLRQRGYQVTTCFDGEQALAHSRQQVFSLILLDWLLPRRDGLSVLTALRAQHNTPVIMLTACGDEQQRIRGLQCGADDYLTKPFNITELMLRIEAVLRRSGTPVTREPDSQPSLCYAGLELRAEDQQLCWQQQSQPLTPTEYSLLQQLMRCAGEVLSKPMLYQEVMGRPWSRYDRSLDMHISKLRRKLTQLGCLECQIQTVHGQGYRLR